MESVPFSIIKEKIIKTDEVLRMYVNNKEELEKLQHSYDSLKKKYEKALNQIYRLKLEIETGSFSFNFNKNRTEKLENELKELKLKYDQIVSDYHEQVNTHEVKYQSISEELVQCKQALEMFKKGEPKDKTSKKHKTLQLDDDKIRILEKNSELTSAIQELKEKAKQCKALKYDISTLNQTLVNIREKSSKEHAILRLENSKLRDQLEKMKNHIVSEQQLKFLEFELDQKKKEISEIKLSHSQIISKIVAERDKRITILNNEINKLNNVDKSRELPRLLENFDSLVSDEVKDVARVSESDCESVTEIFKEMYIPDIITPFVEEAAFDGTTSSEVCSNRRDCSFETNSESPIANLLPVVVTGSDEQIGFKGDTAAELPISKIVETQVDKKTELYDKVRRLKQNRLKQLQRIKKTNKANIKRYVKRVVTNISKSFNNENDTILKAIEILQRANVQFTITNKVAASHNCKPKPCHSCAEDSGCYANSLASQNTNNSSLIAKLSEALDKKFHEHTRPKRRKRPKATKCYSLASETEPELAPLFSGCSVLERNKMLLKKAKLETSGGSSDLDCLNLANDFIENEFRGFTEDEVEACERYSFRFSQFERSVSDVDSVGVVVTNSQAKETVTNVGEMEQIKLLKRSLVDSGYSANVSDASVVASPANLDLLDPLDVISPLPTDSEFFNSVLKSAKPETSSDANQRTNCDKGSCDNEKSLVLNNTNELESEKNIKLLNHKIDCLHWGPTSDQSKVDFKDTTPESSQKRVTGTIILNTAPGTTLNTAPESSLSTAPESSLSTAPESSLKSASVDANAKINLQPIGNEIELKRGNLNQEENDSGIWKVGAQTSDMLFSKSANKLPHLNDDLQELTYNEAEMRKNDKEEEKVVEATQELNGPKLVNSVLGLDNSTLHSQNVGQCPEENESRSNKQIVENQTVELPNARNFQQKCCKSESESISDLVNSEQKAEDKNAFCRSSKLEGTKALELQTGSWKIKNKPELPFRGPKLEPNEVLEFQLDHENSYLKPQSREVSESPNCGPNSLLNCKNTPKLETSHEENDQNNVVEVNNAINFLEYCCKPDSKLVFDVANSVFDLVSSERKPLNSHPTQIKNESGQHESKSETNQALELRLCQKNSLLKAQTEKVLKSLCHEPNSPYNCNNSPSLDVTSDMNTSIIPYTTEPIKNDATILLQKEDDSLENRKSSAANSRISDTRRDTNLVKTNRNMHNLEIRSEPPSNLKSLIKGNDTKSCNNAASEAENEETFEVNFEADQLGPINKACISPTNELSLAENNLKTGDAKSTSDIKTEAKTSNLNPTCNFIKSEQELLGRSDIKSPNLKLNEKKSFNLKLKEKKSPNLKLNEKKSSNLKFNENNSGFNFAIEPPRTFENCAPNLENITVSEVRGSENATKWKVEILQNYVIRQSCVKPGVVTVAQKPSNKNEHLGITSSTTAPQKDTILNLDDVKHAEIQKAVENLVTEEVGHSVDVKSNNQVLEKAENTIKTDNEVQKEVESTIKADNQVQKEVGNTIKTDNQVQEELENIIKVDNQAQEKVTATSSQVRQSHYNLRQLKRKSFAYPTNKREKLKPKVNHLEREDVTMTGNHTTRYNSRKCRRSNSRLISHCSDSSEVMSLSEPNSIDEVDVTKTEQHQSNCDLSFSDKLDDSDYLKGTLEGNSDQFGGNFDKLGGDSGQLGSSNDHFGGNHDQLGGQRDQLGGNRDQVRGNRDQLEGDSDQFKGNYDQLEGNSHQLEGNSDQLGDNSGQVKGNSDQIEANSHRLEDNSDHLEGDSGQLEGNSGQLVGNSGHLEDNCGHLEGKSGHLEDNCSHLEGNSGHLEDNCGHLEGNSGYLEGNSGHLEDKCGHLEGNSGHLEDHCGHLEGNSGHLEDNCGHLKGNSGHPEGNFGHLEDKCGHLEGNSGHLEGNSGHLEDNSGHLEDKCGHLEGNSNHLEDNCGHLQGNFGHLESNSGHLEDNFGHFEGNSSHFEDNCDYLKGSSGYLEDNSGCLKGNLTKKVNEQCLENQRKFLFGSDSDSDDDLNESKQPEATKSCVTELLELQNSILLKAETLEACESKKQKLGPHEPPITEFELLNSLNNFKSNSESYAQSCAEFGRDSDCELSGSESESYSSQSKSSNSESESSDSETESSEFESSSSEFKLNSSKFGLLKGDFNFNRSEFGLAKNEYSLNKSDEMSINRSELGLNKSEFGYNKGELKPSRSEFERSGGEFERSGGEFEPSGGEFERSGGEFERSGGEFKRSGGQFERSGGEFERSGGEFERSGGEFERSRGEFERNTGKFGVTRSEFGVNSNEFGINKKELESRNSDSQLKSDKFESVETNFKMINKKIELLNEKLELVSNLPEVVKAFNFSNRKFESLGKSGSIKTSELINMKSELSNIKSEISNNKNLHNLTAPKVEDSMLNSLNNSVESHSEVRQKTPLSGDSDSDMELPPEEMEISKTIVLKRRAERLNSGLRKSVSKIRRVSSLGMDLQDESSRENTPARKKRRRNVAGKSVVMEANMSKRLGEFRTSKKTGLLDSSNVGALEQSDTDRPSNDRISTNADVDMDLMGSSNVGVSGRVQLDSNRLRGSTISGEANVNPAWGSNNVEVTEYQGKIPSDAQSVHRKSISTSKINNQRLIECDEEQIKTETFGHFETKGVENRQSLNIKITSSTKELSSNEPHDNWRDAVASTNVNLDCEVNPNYRVNPSRRMYSGLKVYPSRKVHPNCKVNPSHKVTQNPDVTDPYASLTYVKQPKKRVAHSKREAAPDKSDSSLNSTANSQNTSLTNPEERPTLEPTRATIISKINAKVAKAPTKTKPRSSVKKVLEMSTETNPNILDTLLSEMGPSRKIPVPACPRSPEPIDNCTNEEPKIIPLEKVEICRNKANQLLSKLENFAYEDKVLDEVVQQFQTQDAEYVAELILDRIILDIHDKPTSGDSAAPMMTDTQRVMLGLMSRLEKLEGWEIFDNYLSLAENYLFQIENLKEIDPVTRMYVAICKLRMDIHRMRRMCCEAFYFMGDFAIPFFFAVLTSWVEVLPMAHDSTDNSLVKVMIQLIHLKGAKPGHNLLPLRDLIVKYHGYPSERWNSDEVFKEIFYYFLRNPVRSSDFAILVFCKNMPAKWMYDQIVNTVQPILVKINVDNLKATVIILIGNIFSQFKKNEDIEYVVKIRDWLRSLDEDSTPVLIKHSIYLSIRRLPRKKLKKGG